MKVPKLREQGYSEALEAAGIAAEPALIQRPHDPTFAAAAEAVARLLARPESVDAVFCFNDTLALAAIRHLLSEGLRVPQDVAVVGVDDIQIGQVSTPTLSTIAPDKPTRCAARSSSSSSWASTVSASIRRPRTPASSHAATGRACWCGPRCRTPTSSHRGRSSGW